MLLIVTATASELAAALPDLPDLPGRPNLSAIEQGKTQALHLKGEAVLVQACGVGMLNAGLSLGAALGAGHHRHEITGVLNLGLAGSFDLERLPLGSICAVRRETWPEYGLGLENGVVDARALKFPLARLNGEAVVNNQGAEVWDSLDLDPDKAAAAMGLHLPDHWHRAAGLTVNTVSGTPGRAGTLQRAHGAELENMEGFALAYACALARVPFLEIRSVSNLVGSRDKAHWDLTGGLKALGTAAKTLLSPG